MTGYVYKLVCPDSGKILYIGSTVKDLRTRLWSHICSTSSDTSPIYTYLREHKIKPIIEPVQEVSFSDVKELRDCELQWIEHHFENGHPILNKRRILKPIPKKYEQPLVPFQSLTIDARRTLIMEQHRIHDETGEKLSITNLIIKIIKEWQALKEK